MFETKTEGPLTCRYRAIIFADQYDMDSDKLAFACDDELMLQSFLCGAGAFARRLGRDAGAATYDSHNPEAKLGWYGDEAAGELIDWPVLRALMMRGL